MKLTCDAVVFDSDGVLVDSVVAVEAAWLQLCDEFGLDTPEVMAAIHGVRAEDTLAARLEPERAAAAVARLADLEQERVPGVRAVPGAAALVASLPAGRWGIVTSGSRRLATARFAVAGIADPPVLVTADDVTRGKPFPDPYLAAAAALGVDGSALVVFEDAPSGAAAARACGAAVVAVATTHPKGSFEAVATVEDLRGVSVGGDGPLTVSLRAF
ncbi:MAG: HAD-IA family hydrolase [Acidimicrobiia bacterium]